MDEQEAERLKRQFANLIEEGQQQGEGAAEPAEEAGEVAEARQAVGEVLTDPLYDLVTEIGRTIDFYHRQHRGEQVSNIVLSGGSAVIPGLAQFVAEQTGIATELANPYQHLVCDPEQATDGYLADVGPATVVATGLAMQDMLED